MKRAVIIGGGFSGSLIAKHLGKRFDVTLIDSKDYFEFTPGVLRTIVEPGHIKKIQALHNNYLKGARVLIGYVKSVTKKEVIFDGKKIKYDYLFICSGSRYNIPIKEQNLVIATRADHLRSFHDQLERADDVLIIGGGLVGTELAAEICTYYPEKKITIVHANDRLIERNPKKASKHAYNFLKKRGVKIFFNEFVLESKTNGKTYYTNKGRNVKTDIAFLCTGIIPNYDFMKKYFNNILNEKNQIKVNEYLQVIGNGNIFAVGDVNDISLEKTAQNSKWQGRIAFRNAIRLEKKRNLIKYRPIQTPLVISLGKWNGIFIWKNFVFSGFIPGIMKTMIERFNMFFYGKFYFW